MRRYKLVLASCFAALPPLTWAIAPAVGQSTAPEPALSAPAGPMASPDPMAARLSAERLATIEPGDYTAGDTLAFSIAPYGDKYLLRFSTSPESYVLTTQRVPLGGRALFYDTGAIALRVSVWGGITLYTADAPGGLPATRVSNLDLPARAPVSRDDLSGALRDEEGHFAYTQKLRLRFVAAPAVLAAGDTVRGQAFDTLISTAAGIEKLLASPGGHQAVADRFDTVRIVESARPGIRVRGKTLLVGFTPAEGAAGRASSRAVAYTLGKILSVAEPA